MPGPKKKSEATLTIREFAVLAKCSTATVSRVFSNKPGVSEEKRKGIMELANRVGFSPNRMAQNLALQKSYLIGVVTPDLRDQKFLSFLESFLPLAAELGYQVIVNNSERSAQKEAALVRKLRQERADGMILFPVFEADRESGVDHLVQARMVHYPFVVIGKLPSLGFDTIDLQDQVVGVEAAKHLYDLGHRKIAFVGHRKNCLSSEDKLDGFRRGLSDRQVLLSSDSVIEANPQWRNQLASLLSHEKGKPTAIVVPDARFTEKVILEIITLGYEIPKDFSLLVLDQSPFDADARIGITSFETDYNAMAEKTMELLMRRIDDETVESDSTALPASLSKNESTVAV